MIRGFAFILLFGFLLNRHLKIIRMTLSIQFPLKRQVIVCFLSMRKRHKCKLNFTNKFKISKKYVNFNIRKITYPFVFKHDFNWSN